MNGIVAENGKVVTDEMIADWESALERDEARTQLSLSSVQSNHKLMRCSHCLVACS